MKKFFLLLSIILVLFSLTGCRLIDKLLFEDGLDDEPIEEPWETGIW